MVGPKSIGNWLSIKHGPAINNKLHPGRLELGQSGFYFSAELQIKYRYNKTRPGQK